MKKPAGKSVYTAPFATAPARNGPSVYVAGGYLVQNSFAQAIYLECRILQHYDRRTTLISSGTSAPDR